MKKILLAVLFASTHLYAADDEYPTCDSQAEDSATSCPSCYSAGDPEIASAPEDQQVVCVESSDAG